MGLGEGGNEYPCMIFGTGIPIEAHPVDPPAETNESVILQDNIVLNFDGVNGSDTFIEEAHNLTASGGKRYAVDTSESFSGTAALRMWRETDPHPRHSAFSYTLPQTTIDASQEMSFAFKYGNDLNSYLLVDAYAGGAGAPGVYIYVYMPTGSPGILEIETYNSPDENWQTVNLWHEIPQVQLQRNRWYHIRVAFDATNCYVALDGEWVSAFAHKFRAGDLGLFDSISTFLNAGSVNGDMWIDQMRWSSVDLGDLKLPLLVDVAKANVLATPYSPDSLHAISGSAHIRALPLSPVVPTEVARSPIKASAFSTGLDVGFVPYSSIVKAHVLPVMAYGLKIVPVQHQLVRLSPYSAGVDYAFLTQTPNVKVSPISPDAFVGTVGAKFIPTVNLNTQNVGL